MTKYPRGSEWRKWDLHIHTPGTAKNNQYPSDSNWTEYLATLERHNDIAVLGITDYFSIDNYIKAKSFQGAGRLQGKYLIPNIELRVLPVTRSDTPINLHVIFDPDLDIECIKREFLRKLQMQYQGANFTADRNDLIALGRQYKSNESLDEFCAWQEGIGQFNISYDKVRDALSAPCLQGHFLIAVSNKSSDGNSGIQDSALRASRQEIYRMAHIIFSSNVNDIAYFLGKGCDSPEKVIKDYGSLKPCVLGSDAHSIATICQFPNNRTTWIKADPTFAGLKQIFFEPEDRVCIQETCPETKSIYNLIDTITLSEAGFWTQTIPLNENLSVIIGGRSTGKSTLLESIAKKISPNSEKSSYDSEDQTNRKSFINEHINSISVNWKDKTDNTDRWVDYFQQSRMYEIAKDQHKVDELVENIIKEDSTNASLLSTLENEISINQDAIISQCTNLVSLYKSYLECCNNIKTSGNISGIKQEIEQLQKAADLLKKDSGMSDDEYTKFEKQQDELSKQKATHETIQKDKSAVDNLKNKSILNPAFRYELNNLSEERRSTFEQSYDSFVADVVKNWNRYIDDESQKIQKESAACIAAIQSIEKTPIYIKGIQYIAANKQYADYQERIN